MFRKFSLASVVVFFLAVSAACGKGPTSPSGGYDPFSTWDYSQGAKPIPVNIPLEMPDGKGTITVTYLTPGENQSSRAGQAAFVYTRIANRTDRYLNIVPGVVDSPDENPGFCGRDVSVFHNYSIFDLKPREEKEVIFGFSSADAGVIPYLRFAAYYEDDRRGQFWSTTPADWTLDLHLGWNIR